jgi:hypothetical protein
MGPKAAKKSPAMLAAEALESWTAQEAMWFKAKVVLQRTLDGARKHLAREYDARDQLVQLIQQEAERREKADYASRETLGALSVASRELRQRVKATDDRLEAQWQLLDEASMSKAWLSLEVEHRVADDLQETRLIDRGVETVEMLVKRMRDRIIALRRAEVRAESLERQAIKLMSSLGRESLWPSRLGSRHVVCIGYFGVIPGHTLLRSVAQENPSPRGLVFTRVLGEPQDTREATFCTEDSMTLAAVTQRSFVTALSSSLPDVPAHVAETARLIASSDRPTFVALAGVSSPDDGGPGVIRMYENRAAVDVEEMIELLRGRADDAVAFVVDVLKPTVGTSGGWSLVYVPGAPALTLRHRVTSKASQRHPAPAFAALAVVIGAASRMPNRAVVGAVASSCSRLFARDDLSPHGIMKAVRFAIASPHMAIDMVEDANATALSAVRHLAGAASDDAVSRSGDEELLAKVADVLRGEGRSV